MKEKSVAIIGTLDTKGDQIEYLKQKIDIMKAVYKLYKIGKRRKMIVRIGT